MKYIFFLCSLLFVSNAQDFTISVSPQTQSIVNGSTATYQIRITPNNGYNASVFLSVESKLSSSAITLTRAVVNYPYSDTKLDIKPTPIDTGTFVLTIRGKNTGVESVIQCTLNVKKNNLWTAVRYPFIFETHSNKNIIVDKKGIVNTYQSSIFLGKKLYIWKYNNQKWDLSSSFDHTQPSTVMRNTDIWYDVDSNIWCTAENGLLKYDLKFITAYNKNTDPFTCFAPESIYPAAKKIYATCAFNEREFYKYENLQWSRIQIDKKYSTRYISDKIVVDSNDQMWIATFSGMLCVNDTSQRMYDKTNSGLLEDSIVTTCLGKNGFLYALSVTNKSYNIYKYNGIDWQKLNVTIPLQYNNISVNVSKMLVENDQYIWLNCGSNLFYLNGNILTSYNTSNSPIPTYITNVELDNNQNLWIEVGDYWYKKDNPYVIIFNPNGIVGVPLISTNVEETTTVQSLQVYPNPTNEQITIQTDNNNSTVTVVDVLGEVLYRHQSSELSFTINTQQYPDGVYFVRVGEKVKSFIVQH